MITENLYQPFEIVYKETDECLKVTHKHNFFELIYIIEGTKHLKTTAYRFTSHDFIHD